MKGNLRKNRYEISASDIKYGLRLNPNGSMEVLDQQHSVAPYQEPCGAPPNIAMGIHPTVSPRAHATALEVVFVNPPGIWVVRQG